MPLALGETLERRYKIDKKLGEGGFGAVYRAYDTRLDVLCAVKESFDSSEEAARQFKRGASMLASLRHPHLPRVTDFFDIPNKGLYLVMDFVQGEDLLTRIQRLHQPLPEDQVVDWLKQICEALSYIHSQNPPVIHRDIKPQNIIIDQSGNAILVDFGLAKLFDAGQRTSLGARGLTPGFAPVEQYGSGATDARSDIYSLGATAYAMLTAQAPPESIQRVVNAETLTSPRGLIRSISEPLSDAIMQALEIDPRRRPQTVQEFFGKLPIEGQERKVAGQRTQPETLVSQVNNLPPATGEIIDVVLERVIDSNHKPVTKSQFLAAGRFWLVRGGIKESGDGRPVNAENINNWIGVLRRNPGIKFSIEDSLLVRPESLERQANTLTLELAPGVSMEFVRVPAGEFLMGSDPKKDKQVREDETPQHRVRLDEYLIGKYPITNIQYLAFVQAAGYKKKPGHWENGKIPQGKLDHPVVYVNWDDAVAFCAWASKVSGQQVRIPSEAEWEKAARGTDGRLYPWGDQTPDAQRCNFNGNIGDTTPVGRYSSTGDGPYGCADMAGNTWEWVADWYDETYYKSSPSNNTAGPSSGEKRVLRGGSWNHYAITLRVSFRNKEDPDYWDYDYGFRCVATLKSRLK